VLHVLHLLPHVQHDLDPGQIDAEVARQREDGLEPLESSSESRVLPSVREGLSRPSRSYIRSVCGWMLYF
jgi:hypothetical protein